MQSETVIYNGRVVPKEGFRTFIYGPNDKQKLVNSYAEFEKEIATGVWFVKKEQVPAPVVEKIQEEDRNKKRGK